MHFPTLLRQVRSLHGLLTFLLAFSASNLAQAIVYTPGKFSVTETGSASYSIPIQVPPGTAGMQPRLALHYDSRSGNGQLGVGWSLQGLSNIQRCGATIALEGTRSTDNRFCMDGQRLIATAGLYGDVNTEYRTERETFTKVVGIAGSSFKAYTKDGLEIEYTPLNVQTRGCFQACIPENSIVILPWVWLPSKVQDMSGNYYTVTYQSFGDGNLYPSSIQYTGNVNGLAPYNSVRFEYETRADTIVRFGRLTPINTTQRLTKISTYAGTTLVKTYVLNYGATLSPSFKSRLKTLTECDGGTPGATQKCLAPTSFSYQDFVPLTIAPSFGFAGYGLNAGGWSNQNVHPRLMGDVDGDGVADIVGFANAGISAALGSGAGGFNAAPAWSMADFGAAAGWANQDSHPRFLADINGDGRADVVGFFGNTVYFATSTGSGFSAKQTLTAFVPTQNWSSNATFPRFVADVNGDGMADLVGFASDGVYVGLSTGATFAGAVRWLAGFGTAAGFSDVNVYPRMIADVNGDGMADMVAFSSEGVYVAVSYGTGFSLPRRWLPNEFGAGAAAGGWASQAIHPRYLADVNGDGLADVVGFADTGVRVALSNGNGFQPSSQWIGQFGRSSAAGGWSSNDTYPRQLVDVDGDGRADVVGFGQNGTTVALSNGINSFVTVGAPLSIPTQFGGAQGWSSQSVYPRTFADIDGDGVLDILGFANNGVWIANANNGGKQPDLLTFIQNGAGASTQIRYLPTTNTFAHTRGVGAVYPYLDLRHPLYVVNQTATSTGVSTSPDYFTVYAYAGAKYHQTAATFLGFASVKANDSRQLTTTDTYLQGYDFGGYSSFGLKSSSETRTQNGSGPLIRKIDTEWRFGTPTAGTHNRPFPYPYTTRENFFDVVNAGVPYGWRQSTIEGIEDYGNPTVVRGTSSDGFGEVVSSTYDNDAVRWILGRKRTQVTTKSKPSGVLPLSLTRTKYFSYYPATGLLQQEITEPNNPSLRLQADHAYDPYGNLRTTTVSGGVVGATSYVAPRTTTIGYDPQGRFATSVQNALLQSETRTYDPNFGGLKSVIGPNQVTTTWDYDTFGRKIAETPQSGSGVPTTWEYVKCGAGSSCSWAAYMIYMRKSGAPTVRQEYDILDRLTREWTDGFVAGSSIMTKGTDYNGLGRVVAVYEPAHYPGPYPFTRFDTYDALERVTQQTAPNLGITTRAYSGFSVTTTNAKSQQTVSVTNTQGQLVSVTNANNGNATLEKSTISYDYDSFGNLAKTVDQKNNVVQMGYDLLGRKTSMTDPDMGLWTYVYDALGQLVQQTDPKGRAAATPYTSTVKYDLLGRVTERRNIDQVSTWVYDSCTKGVGKLCSETTIDGFSRTHSYDSFGRPATTTTNIVGTSYSTGVSYDSFGRVLGTYYPSVTVGTTTTTLVLKNVYNASGYLSEIRDNASNALYWQANSLTADLQVAQETLGNGAVTARQINANTHWVEGIGTTKGATTVQSQGFAYDALGNLLSRTERCVNSTCTASLAETFGYDNLNRLITVTSASNPAVNRSYAYDSIGNITYKSDIGSLVYAGATGGVRPHAVTSVTGTVNGVVNPTFIYDANGNMTSGAGWTIAYTSYDMPSSMSTTGLLVPTTFRYDTDRQRFLESFYVGTIHYVRFGGGVLFERLQNGSLLEYKHYIYAPSGLVALYTQRNAAAPTLSEIRYFHKDHLGSTSVITDANGSVVERLSYDAWGKRRNADGSNPASPPPSLTRYGFTGHEHLDEVGLVHMNGRVYNPTLGRFVSPDPGVQYPKYSQSYNRYAYTINNPLSFVDPSGFEYGDYGSSFAYSYDPTFNSSYYFDTGSSFTDFTPTLSFGFSDLGLPSSDFSTFNSFDSFSRSFSPVSDSFNRSSGIEFDGNGILTINITVPVTPDRSGDSLSLIGSSVSPELAQFGFDPFADRNLPDIPRPIWTQNPSTLGLVGLGTGVMAAPSILALPGAGLLFEINNLATSDLPVPGSLAFQAARSGGRLGSQSTRQQVNEVAAEMEKRGWTVTHGGGRGRSEEYLPGPGGARKGSSYPDITATKDGKTLRVNTIDTRADGVTPTTREATNASRIRQQTGEHLLLVPKR